MKYIDLIVQTVLIVGGTGLAIAKGDVGNLFLLALLLGPWQFGSSVISSFFRTPAHRYKRVHLFASVLVLLLIFGGVHRAAHTWLAALVAGLALYYYVLTIIEVRYRPAKPGKFLPHTSF